MVKHTQTIRRQQPTNCLSVFDHFVGLVLKGLKISCKTLTFIYFENGDNRNWLKNWSLLIYALQGQFILRQHI